MKRPQRSTGGERVLVDERELVTDAEGEGDGVADGSCTNVTLAVRPLQLLKSKLLQ
jgi:hypothetical protein